MVNRDQIQIDLITLIGGERLLRLTEPQSSLVLEKKLDPTQPIVRQRERLFDVFEAALARAELSATGKPNAVILSGAVEALRPAASGGSLTETRAEVAWARMLSWEAVLPQSGGRFRNAHRSSRSGPSALQFASPSPQLGNEEKNRRGSRDH